MGRKTFWGVGRPGDGCYEQAVNRPNTVTLARPTCANPAFRAKSVTVLALPPPPCYSLRIRADLRLPIAFTVCGWGFHTSGLAPLLPPSYPCHRVDHSRPVRPRGRIGLSSGTRSFPCRNTPLSVA